METEDTRMRLSVVEAKARLEELLDAAVANPVEVMAAGGRAAYLVSKQDFDGMVSAVEELTDQLWLVRAQLARNGGFVAAPETERFLEQLEEGARSETATGARE